MRISDWSSDVCSSDLAGQTPCDGAPRIFRLSPASCIERNDNGLVRLLRTLFSPDEYLIEMLFIGAPAGGRKAQIFKVIVQCCRARAVSCEIIVIHLHDDAPGCRTEQYGRQPAQSRQFESLRSEEHTSELQSLMRITY